MNYYGLIMGAIMLAAVGLGHIIVVKWEYYWGVKSWPAMGVLGVGLIVASLFAGNLILSGGLGMLGATLLWGIHELFKQPKRVAQGLFPRRSDKKPKSAE
jgi:hypothetical protein